LTLTARLSPRSDPMDALVLLASVSFDQSIGQLVCSGRETD